MPFNSTIANSVDDKINKSFLSSTAVLTDKLDQDIHKFRNRISSFNIEN
jgi:hypothetical protein